LEHSNHLIPKVILQNENALCFNFFRKITAALRFSIAHPPIYLFFWLHTCELGHNWQTAIKQTAPKPK